MELTKEEIIKALECCTGINKLDACANCPACLGCNDCADFLREESLSLIKELTDERKRCLEALSELSDNIGLLKEKAKADAVRKMQEKISAKSEYGTINISPWQLDQITKEVLGDNKSYSWVITERGCVITCPKCGERLELCHPDGTEVRYLPHCPWCGKKLEEKK